MADVELMVVGTFAVGMTVRVPRLPVLGETLMGDSFNLSAGGKGANMATAAARQGARAGVVATVGEDSFADLAAHHFAREGIDASGVRRVPGRSTHVGLVYLVPSGQNVIAGYAGASEQLAVADVEAAGEKIRYAKVVIVELGAPDAVVDAALRLAKSAGAATILNPAPARPIDSDVLRLVDYFTPNETEARILVGLLPDDDSTSPAALAARLRERGPRTVIVTCGDRGIVVDGPQERFALPGYPVRAVDTVGAGDAFNGGLAAALIRGLELRDACRWASATAALSTLNAGAVDGLPDKNAVGAALRGWQSILPAEG